MHRLQTVLNSIKILFPFVWIRKTYQVLDVLFLCMSVPAQTCYVFWVKNSLMKLKLTPSLVFFFLNSQLKMFQVRALALFLMYLIIYDRKSLSWYEIRHEILYDAVVPPVLYKLALLDCLQTCIVKSWTIV